VTVAACVEVLQQKYHRLPQTFELDNIVTAIWVKKGDFIPQATIKKILDYMETEGK